MAGFGRIAQTYYRRRAKARQRAALALAAAVLGRAFSKKMENHEYAMALHFLYYNFVRIHLTIKVTPAAIAGVTKRLWKVTDMVNALEAWEASKR